MSRIGREDQQADEEIFPRLLIGKILYLRDALAEESDLAEELDDEAGCLAYKARYWKDRYYRMLSYLYWDCEDDD